MRIFAHGKWQNDGLPVWDCFCSYVASGAWQTLRWCSIWVIIHRRSMKYLFMRLCLWVFRLSGLCGRQKECRSIKAYRCWLLCFIWMWFCKVSAPTGSIFSLSTCWWLLICFLWVDVSFWVFFYTGNTRQWKTGRYIRSSWHSVFWLLSAWEPWCYTGFSELPDTIWFSKRELSFLYLFFCGALARLWWKICVSGRKQRYIKNWHRKIRWPVWKTGTPMKKF